MAVDGTIEMKMEVLGDTVLSRRLSRFGEGVDDFRPAFQHIVVRLRKAAKELFDSDGHGKWPPLSPAYAEWKAKYYPGQPLMRRTDTLYESLTAQGPGAVAEMSPLHLRWGTQVPYARAHQQGSGPLPVRRVIDLLEAEKVGIMKDLQAFLVKMRTVEE